MPTIAIFANGWTAGQPPSVFSRAPRSILPLTSLALPRGIGLCRDAVDCKPALIRRSIEQAKKSKVAGLTIWGSVIRVLIAGIAGPPGRWDRPGNRYNDMRDYCRRSVGWWYNQKWKQHNEGLTMEGGCFAKSGSYRFSEVDLAGPVLNGFHCDKKCCFSDTFFNQAGIGTKHYAVGCRLIHPVVEEGNKAGYRCSPHFRKPKDKPFPLLYHVVDLMSPATININTCGSIHIGKRLFSYTRLWLITPFLVWLRSFRTPGSTAQA